MCFRYETNEKNSIKTTHQVLFVGHQINSSYGLKTKASLSAYIQLVLGIQKKCAHVILSLTSVSFVNQALETNFKIAKYLQR